MKEEINNLKEEIKQLRQRIIGLERDLDYQIQQNNANSNIRQNIRELQEAVAKMANEPVGMMFDYRA